MKQLLLVLAFLFFGILPSAFAQEEVGIETVACEVPIWFAEQYDGIGTNRILAEYKRTGCSEVGLLFETLPETTSKVVTFSQEDVRDDMIRMGAVFVQQDEISDLEEEVAVGEGIRYESPMHTPDGILLLFFNQMGQNFILTEDGFILVRWELPSGIPDEFFNGFGTITLISHFYDGEFWGMHVQMDMTTRLIVGPTHLVLFGPAFNTGDPLFEDGSMQSGNFIWVPLRAEDFNLYLYSVQSAKLVVCPETFMMYYDGPDSSCETRNFEFDEQNEFFNTVVDIHNPD